MSTWLRNRFVKGVGDKACAPVSRVNFKSDILRTNGTNTGVLSLIRLMCGMYLVTQAQNVKKTTVWGISYQVSVSPARTSSSYFPHRKESRRRSCNNEKSLNCGKLLLVFGCSSHLCHDRAEPISFSGGRWTVLNLNRRCHEPQWDRKIFNQYSPMNAW